MKHTHWHLRALPTAKHVSPSKTPAKTKTKKAKEKRMKIHIDRNEQMRAPFSSSDTKKHTQAIVCNCVGTLHKATEKCRCFFFPDKKRSIMFSCQKKKPLALGVSFWKWCSLVLNCKNSTLSSWREKIICMNSDKRLILFFAQEHWNASFEPLFWNRA